MGTATGDFDLTHEELRVVARYVAESAASVLPTFEAACPDDVRPRVAIESAWEFVDGEPRSKRQRVTSLDAHRAAKDAPSESARLAAQAAGDAASAAYLHPIAKEHQVGHILRAAANVACIAEIEAGGNSDAADKFISRARVRATQTLIDVLRLTGEVTVQMVETRAYRNSVEFRFNV